MKILRSRVGVPYLVVEDEIVPLVYASVDDLIALEIMYPGVLDELMSATRVSIEELAGIDAGLDEPEWWTLFNGLLSINEFTTPLHVISQARQALASMPKEELHG